MLFRDGDGVDLVPPLGMAPDDVVGDDRSSGTGVSRPSG